MKTRSRVAALAVIAILAAGCGDDSVEGDDAASTASVGSGSSTAGGGTSSTSSTGGTGGTSTPTVINLSISGKPASQVLQNTEFYFAPRVSGGGGISLRFSATNLPTWASINPTSGRITGTPGPAHVGVYNDIRVTVSGGGKSATSPAYSVAVVSGAPGWAELSWAAPTTAVNGTPLGANLAGYRIYFGQSPGRMNRTVTVATPGILTYIVENLTPATWYFTATAVDTSGLESAFSNIVTKTIL